MKVTDKLRKKKVIFKKKKRKKYKENLEKEIGERKDEDKPFYYRNSSNTFEFGTLSS